MGDDVTTARKIIEKALYEPHLDTRRKADKLLAELSAAGLTIEQGWSEDMDAAPREPNEYTEHGPYIQIKTSNVGREQGTEIEKVWLCYWDPDVEWWQIDTDGEYELCGLQSTPIAWKPLSPPKEQS